MNPTDEQEAIAEFFEARGGDQVIEAGAGTGKSTTLKLLGNRCYPDRAGTYVVFSRANAEEAKGKMPVNVQARTQHSFAYRAVGYQFEHRLPPRAPLITGKDIAEGLGIRKWFPVRAKGRKDISSWRLGALAFEAVARYARSDDLKLSKRHVPFVEGVPNRDELEDLLFPYAEQIWTDAQKIDGWCKFTPDLYMKMWALGDPQLPGDFVMVDEAQDTNPVFAGVIRRQRNVQRVLVGDSQQQLFAWRGAIDFMAEARQWENTETFFLTQCQPMGTMVRVPFLDPDESRSGKHGPQAVLHRDVPIESIKAGDRVVSYNAAGREVRRGQIVTDVSTRTYEGDLIVAKAGSRTSLYAPNHECVVVLGNSLDGKDHVVYISRRGSNYRIGRSPWQYGNGNGPIRRAVAQGADAFWILSTHKTEGEAALHEYLSQVNYGIPGVLFAVTPRATSQRIQYKMDLEEFWRQIGDNSENARACLSHHELLIDHPLWSRSVGDKPRAGWTTKLVTAATNLRNGMKMLSVDEVKGETNGSEQGFNPWSGWKPIEVSREPYSGIIYSLSVDVDHTYIGDGILTHNSFRFGEEIAEEANRWLSYLDSELRLRGLESIDSKLGPVESPDAVLCRTNADVIDQALAAQDRGVKVAIVGGTDEITGLAKAALDLQTKQKTSHPQLSVFKSWSDVLEYVRDESPGGSFGTFMRLVERYGPNRVIQIAEACAHKSEAERFIATVHKVKGLEWSKVLMDAGVAPEMEVLEPDRSELMISYVAATRAQHELDTRAVEYFHRKRAQMEKFKQASTASSAA